MKLAFCYPPMLIYGRPLDFHNLWNDPRGTTGSEILALRMPEEMAKRGHEVTLYVPRPNGDRYADVRVREYGKIFEESGWYDAVHSVLHAKIFDRLAPGPMRVLFQQINDFAYCRKDFHETVDLFISPSESHRARLNKMAPGSEDKWHVLPNGCYPDEYPDAPKVLGRCIYASSPDRGLHLLLEAWPEIKASVPHAHLRIFYYALNKWIGHYSNPNNIINEGDAEHARRVKIAARVLRDAAKLDIAVVGGVSRNRMVTELSEAEVYAFPCDTLIYTEGFSCATLEGCASGALPVISACDALGSIYSGACPMVAEPAHNHMAEWRDLTVRALTDAAWAGEWRARAKSFAAKHAWPLLAERYERILIEHKAREVPAS